MGPAPHGGVALAHHPAVRPGATACDAPPTRRQGVLHRGLGGCAQGGVPATPMASGAVARWGCAPPLRPEVPPHERPLGLRACPGRAPATLGRVPTPAPLGPPRREHRLHGCQPLALLVSPSALIGRGADPRGRGDAGEGVRQPVPGHQRHQGRATPAVWRPRRGRPAGLIVPQARWPPGFAWAAQERERLHWGPEGRRGQRLAAWGEVDGERRWRSVPHRRAEGAAGLRTGPAGAHARGMRGDCGCPGRVTGVPPPGVSSPLRWGGHAPGAVGRGGGPWGQPEAPERAGGAVEPARVGAAPALRRGEGLDPIAAGGGSSWVLLRQATDRQAARIPCPRPHLLQLVSRADRATWRGTGVVGGGSPAGGLAATACRARPPAGTSPACWPVASAAPLSLARSRPAVRLSWALPQALASAGLLRPWGLWRAPTP
jgi:hypothetical protein